MRCGAKKFTEIKKRGPKGAGATGAMGKPTKKGRAHKRTHRAVCRRAACCADFSAHKKSRKRNMDTRKMTIGRKTRRIVDQSRWGVASPRRASSCIFLQTRRLVSIINTVGQRAKIGLVPCDWRAVLATVKIASLAAPFLFLPPLAPSSTTNQPTDLLLLPSPPR